MSKKTKQHRSLFALVYANNTNTVLARLDVHARVKLERFPGRLKKQEIAIDPVRSEGSKLEDEFHLLALTDFLVDQA